MTPNSCAEYIRCLYIKLKGIEEVSESALQSSNDKIEIIRSKQIVCLYVNSFEITECCWQTDTRNFRIRCCIQMDIMNATVNSIFEKIMAEQLHLLASVKNFPHAEASLKVLIEDSKFLPQQEEFTLLKQLVNALLSVRLYNRATVTTRATRINALPPAQEHRGIPKELFQGLEHIEDDTKYSVGGKRKFKSKRRKFADSSGSPISGYGVDVSIGVGRVPHITNLHNSRHAETVTEPIVLKPASNLAKLAALLGKSSKS